MAAPARPAPLILGAGGLLGRALAARLETEYPGTVAATRVEADVTDRFRLEAEIERLQPGVVINCAALSDPDACEIDPDRARRINVEGAENAALACAASGLRLVHLSTALVFDGTRRKPYAESDPPAPRSVCGRTRAQGEARIAARLENHLIVRTYWVFGPGRPNAVDTILDRGRDERVLRVAGDEVASPTSAEDCAAAVARLLRSDHRGIVHFANRGSCSRLDLARAALRLAGDDPARVRPIPAGEEGRLAMRPAFAVLDTALYAGLTGAAPRTWQEALAAYLAAAGAAGAGGIRRRGEA